MRDIRSIFLIFIFIFPLISPFAGASAHDVSPDLDPRVLIETPEETAEREAADPIVNEREIVPQITSYVCENSRLTGDESQGILDLLKSGFTGKQIAGETEENDEREELASNELILQNPENPDEAVQVEIPNQKFKPWEISQFINSYIKGPFAFGVVLEDSLRTGRCETYSSPDCTLTGRNLKFRNSGVGIIENLKPIREELGDFLDGNRNFSQFSDEENEVLRTALLTDTSVDEQGNVTESQLKTVQRLEKQLIPNSILTEQFEARLQTNCNNSACVISTYSLFDKYFNVWMSSEMVVSVFGPSLLYQTKALFGWNARRGFLSGVKNGYNEFLDRFRSKFVTPESFLGKLTTKRIQTRIDRNGWREWFQGMTGGNSDGTGYYLFKTEEFQIWWGKQGAAGGFLETLKTAEQKAEFIRLLKDMRSFLRAAEARNNTAKGAWELAKAKLPPGSAVTKQKYIDWGRDTVDWMDEVYDAGLGADYIEWLVRHPNAGFYDKGVKEVLEGGDDVIVNLFHEHRNMQRILKKFKEDGSFRGFENDAARFGSVFETSGDDLVYYTFDAANAQTGRTLSYSNLKPAASGRTDQWVQLDTGEFVPYTQQSVSFIQNRIGGNPQISQGNWKVGGKFTPENITSRITNARTGPGANMHFGTKNVQQMLNTVREKNFVSRRYWNALDKLIAQEDELIRSYFTIKGGAKWTVLPFGYWWAKKGFGVDGISQYRLPDTWHDLKFTHGDENIYDYAYIDFFANEGSDQGDLFLQMINKLPWTLIVDTLSDKYNPVKNLYDSLTKNQLRNETENLAFYFTGPEECINCTMVLRSPDLTEFSPFFFVEDKQITSYILEDTISEKARNKGQTLIAFAGHTNLEGQSGEDEGVPIDLAEAIKNESITDRDLRAEKPRTCTQALKDLDFAGANIGAVLPKGSSVGAVLGGLQSITYATFFWAGIFSTIAVQVVIAPQLNGCVDVDEGYYVHYFVPVQEEQDEQGGTTEKSTEKVSDFIEDFRETFSDAFEGDSETFTQQAAQDLGDELDRFVKDSKNNDIVQATMTMQGLSSGQLKSRDLFYFWCGKSCEIAPAIYRTDGSEEIRGVNGTNVNIDFEKGEITVDGKPIVTNEDHVRSATINLGVPGLEIPKTITETCIEPTLDVAIEINAAGEARVLNNDLLNCIRQGVLEQTGLPMQIGVNKLNDAFGDLELVVTNTHPNIRPLGDKIIAEGIPRKIADGTDSKILILANKQVELSSSNDQETGVGTLDSLQFANGSLIVKPNGCFITWLRHHEDGILPKDLVRGLKTDLDREFNEQTQCEEPVVDFELFGDVESDFRTNQVDKFNESLQYLGPFTVFETPTQRFVISAEQENGVCKDHLRIIDKETGEVQDFVGIITQTPDGFKITTEDGKEHEVKFSTKDGAPFLQLDEDKPELLTSAQGKNGSFYYDPDKGLWFAENAQLLPLIEAFRDGIAATVAPNGEVTANASGNILNFNQGEDDSTFLNLPSLPEERVLIAIILILLVTTFVFVQRKR